MDQNFFEENPSILDAEPVTAATPEVDTFPDESADDVYGLLYLGALTKELHMMGHSFLLRTLKTGEELAIGLIVKEHMGTSTAAKAHATATVAACLETVDGQALLPPLGPDQVSGVQKKYEYLRDNWYYPVIEAIYIEYLGLMQRQVDALEALRGNS